MPGRLVTAFCLMALLSSVTLAAAPVVEPTGMWSGKIKDESLRKLAPPSDFIADSETWKKLWTAWRPGEKLPKVDFTKELILVGTVPGPNLVIMRATIDDNGALKDGYFEIPLPAKLFDENPPAITLRWIDFYRN